MNVLLLRGRGVSGVQDSARTSYWLQPVSKSSTWSPKQNKITRLRLAPHVCTVSTVGQIKPHFHPFRSCHLPTWCHSFWSKARNSFPTHDSLSQQTQRLNFWSLLSSFTTRGSALPQQCFSHVTFLQEWQTKLKCAGDIISQYNKVTERTAAGWNEIIYFDITTEKSYMLSIDDFCVSLEMIEHDCLISSNWVTAVAKVSYFDDLIEKHSAMFKSPQSLSLTTLISLDSELTWFYRPASCQFKWGNNLNLDCKRWKVCWNPTWIMEWWKKQYENLQTPKCCIRKYTWERSHWNSDFWSTHIFTSF